MNRTELKQFDNALTGFYPQCSPEQRKLICERFLGHSYPRALIVLKTHASNHDFLSIPQLFEGLRADAASKGDPKPRDIPLPDLLRYANAWLTGVDDRETLVRFYRQLWQGYRTDAQAREARCAAQVDKLEHPDAAATYARIRKQWEVQWAGALKGIKLWCRRALLNVEGVSEEEAKTLSELVDAPVETFKMALAELRAGVVMEAECPV